MEIFKNWSGSMMFTPGEICTPESEEQVCQPIKKATVEGANAIMGAMAFPAE